MNLRLKCGSSSLPPGYILRLIFIFSTRGATRILAFWLSSSRNTTRVYITYGLLMRMTIYKQHIWIRHGKRKTVTSSDTHFHDLTFDELSTKLNELLFKNWAQNFGSRKRKRPALYPHDLKGLMFSRPTHVSRRKRSASRAQISIWILVFEYVRVHELGQIDHRHWPTVEGGKWIMLSLNRLPIFFRCCYLLPTKVLAKWDDVSSLFQVSSSLVVS